MESHKKYLNYVFLIFKEILNIGHVCKMILKDILKKKANIPNLNNN